jgi:Schlafen, AlbA_2
MASDQARAQPPTGMLVGESCPSFPEWNSAWRAFFDGDFSLTGAQAPPHDLVLLREVADAAWLGPVHVTATQLSIDVQGVDVQGCELELNSATGPSTRRVDRPGTIVIYLEDGLPADGWLWLKRDTTWLDYRSLDPRSGWTAQGKGGPTGVDIDVPFEPQAAVEALVAAGEGPQVEYKRQLPGKAAQERRPALKTVAAFANGTGGTLVFGVDRDEATVTGLGDQDPTRLRDQLADLVRATIIPTPQFQIQHYRIGEQTVLVLDVEAGPSPPYGLSVDSGSRDKPEFYVRRASTYPAQPNDLREATLSRQDANPARYPWPGSG